VNETTTAVDVPALLVAVIETDCNWLTSEVVVDVWPLLRVNGTETENWPPKLSDCVLVNHCWALGPMGTGTVLLPEEVVNWNASEDRSRVVAYPVTCSVSELVDSAETSAFVSCTGPEGTERESVAGELGVTSKPLARANDGVTVIVPATLPVCRLRGALWNRKGDGLPAAGELNRRIGWQAPSIDRESQFPSEC
jgi:hypothetical protein